MTAKVIYEGDLRVKMTHIYSGVEVITDAPLDNQGKAQAFSPTDLVATGLVNCMLTIIGIAARTHGFSIDGTVGEVTKIMASDPRRIGAVEVKLYIKGQAQYSEKEKEIIQRSGRTCPVALSLHPDVRQDIEFIFPA